MEVLGISGEQCFLYSILGITLSQIYKKSFQIKVKGQHECAENGCCIWNSELQLIEVMGRFMVNSLHIVTAYLGSKALFILSMVIKIWFLGCNLFKGRNSISLSLLINYSMQCILLLFLLWKEQEHRPATPDYTGYF